MCGLSGVAAVLGPVLDARYSGDASRDEEARCARHLDDDERAEGGVALRLDAAVRRDAGDAVGLLVAERARGVDVAERRERAHGSGVFGLGT